MSSIVVIVLEAHPIEDCLTDALPGSEPVVVEINPDEMPLTNSVTYSLRGKAGEVLPALILKLPFVSDEM